MRIDKLIQGKDDRVIFGTVGSLLTDKKVHEELGMAITSKDDDEWYIIYNGNDLLGFAVTRKTKSTKALHIRFLYLLDIDQAHKFKKLLIKEIIKNATNDNLKAVWTNDRKKERVWKDLKFDFTERSRGEFGRWEKKL